jgi:hypothetical protein
MTTTTAKYNTDHGMPYDRGRADSYYDRPYEPHYYPAGTHRGERIVEGVMTESQIQAYKVGYDDNERRGLKKG